jgi:HPt (histidine-containing phosphotransfer) domain-containing protein
MEKPNIDYILKLARGEENVKLKLIKVLQYELPIEMEAYYENIKSNQWQQAAFHVHKIKHKIAILGLEETYLMAEKYENQLSENRTDLQRDFENNLKLILHFVNSL